MHQNVYISIADPLFACGTVDGLVSQDAQPRRSAAAHLHHIVLAWTFIGISQPCRCSEKVGLAQESIMTGR